METQQNRIMHTLFQKLNHSKVFHNLNEQEFSWVLYDVGNLAYTMLACSLIPIWFKHLAIGNGAGQISSDQATAYYSLTIAFGIYDIFSKGASFLGSIVIAAIKFAGGTINTAVASLAIFFALGFLFLRAADRAENGRSRKKGNSAGGDMSAGTGMPLSGGTAGL